jgi:hypothetical protein
MQKKKYNTLENLDPEFPTMIAWPQQTSLKEKSMFLSDFCANNINSFSIIIYCPPEVNVINILRANFSYKCCFGSFSLVTGT